MTEYDEVVHVETLKEYRAVLDKWFDKGYDWSTTLRSQDHHEEYLNRSGARYLTLDANRKIGYSFGLAIDTTKAMSFKEFMAKERNEVTPWVPAPEDIPEREVTYEVSVEEMAFIKEAKDSEYPASYLMVHDGEYTNMFSGVEYGTTFERDLLKYIAGDDRVVFQLKDPLFMLKGKDTDGDAVYFTVDGVGAPTYSYEESDAFVASHEEITLWNTPFLGDCAGGRMMGLLGPIRASPSRSLCSIGTRDTV